jgi:glycosyltransferase involved in cell wall biosynthesis
MKVLHTIQSLSKNQAGLFYFLNDLTRWQSDLGCNVTVVGLEDKAGHEDEQLWKHISAEFVQVAGPNVFPIARNFSSTLERLKPDLIHCHGLWTFHSLAVPSYCRKTNTPYIVSPHGMLEPWVWRYHAWKKRPIWWLWEKRFLRRASLLMATSGQEAKNLKRFLFLNPMAINPVGVKIPMQINTDLRLSSTSKTMLYLSRIHPKKGLLNLVRAWSIIRPKGWKIVVSGPDSDNYLAVVKRAVHEANLNASFEFPGPVYDAAKWALLQSSDLFVLPTYSENFGIVIAEALACGVPVITTSETPWQELTKHNCGWWVDVGVGPLVKAIREAISLTDHQRLEMGVRGRKLVQENYSWSEISKKSVAVYNWLLGQGPKPECIL